MPHEKYTEAACWKKRKEQTNSETFGNSTYSHEANAIEISRNMEKIVEIQICTVSSQEPYDDETMLAGGIGGR